jgi:hypothetical protein
LQVELRAGGPVRVVGELDLHVNALTLTLNSRLIWSASATVEMTSPTSARSLL